MRLDLHGCRWTILKRFLYLLLFLIGGLGLLSGVVWWQLPGIVNWGLTKSLKQQGFDDVVVQVSDVGVSGASIDRFAIAYKEPDTTLRIQLDEIHLDYTLAQLMKGQAENLFINSLDVVLDYRPDPNANSAPTLPGFELILAAFDSVRAASLPLTNVQLPEITVSHNLASLDVATFDTFEFKAEVVKLENEIAADVLFAEQQALHWTINDDTGWHVQFFDTPEESEIAQDSEQRQLVFKGGLNRVDQSLKFNAELLPLVPHHQFHMAGQKIELSEMVVNGTLKDNETAPGLAVSSSVFIRDLDYQDYSIELVDGQFDAEISQIHDGAEQEPGQIEVKTNSNASLENIGLDGMQADKVVLSVSGDLNLTEEQTRFSSADLSLSAGELKLIDDLELSDTLFSGDVSLTIEGDEWQLELTDSWQLKSQHARYDETELPEGMELGSTQPVTLKGGSDNIALEGKIELEIAAPIVIDKSLSQPISLGNASLLFDKAQIKDGQLFAKGSLSIPELAIGQVSTEANSGDADANEWRFDNLSQTFALNGDQFTSRGSIGSAERGLHIETESKHDFENQRGESEFRLKTIKFEDPQRLNQLTFPTVIPVKLVKGELKLFGTARWIQKNEEWQAKVDVYTQLLDLGGAYDETYFSGVNGDLSLQVYPDILSKEPGKLTVDHADAGVPATGTVIEFIVRPSKLGDLPIVDIRRAQTNLLQGRMSLKPAAYDLNRTNQDLLVELDNIDLKELVELQQLDDIQATGLLTGQLPVVINNGEISIDNGKLQAIAPGGILRYQANEAALQSNQYAETVILALQNFNYDELRADTQYNPDGTLLLTLRMQGNNPDFEQGRPVNLNINLEQNVLKLFESLRLIEGVSDTLDKRVQDFYQQTTTQ